MLKNSNRYINTENLKTLVNALNDKNHIRDTVIQERIGSVETNLNIEEIRALNAEESIKKELNNKIIELTSYIDKKDEILQTNIEDENNNRASEINRIDSNIVSLKNEVKEYTNNQINSTTSALRTEFQSADAGIRSDLTSEIRARENANDNIRQSLNTEIQIRSDNDSKHSEKLAQLEGRINSNQNKSSNNESRLNSVESNIGTIQSNVTNLRETKVSFNGNNQIITGGLTVDDLTVTGKTITKDTETSLVKDNFIIINSDGETLGTQLSGLSIRTNNQNAYGIAYDVENDSVSLGEGYINEENDFAFKPGESKPILTRPASGSEELKDGAMFVWDENRKIAIAKDVIDLDKLKETFTNWGAHNALVAEVHALDNMDLNDGPLGRVTVNENNIIAIKDHDEYQDKQLIQLNAHIINKGNPHNVNWDQIKANALSNITPQMDGNAAIGTSDMVARADHIHPTDNTRAPANHASSYDEYGKATTSLYGHVIVDDKISIESENPIQNKIITTELNKEIARAFNAESELKNSLNSEITRATNEESKLNTRIDNLNFSNLKLNQSQTIKNISQTNGKINVETQDISITQSQVENLEDDLSSLALKDIQIVEAFQAADVTLQSNINSNSNRISNLESTIDTVAEMNASITAIKNSIKADENSYDKLWALSFEPIYDSVGDLISYNPIFTSMDDGVLGI